MTTPEAKPTADELQEWVAQDFYWWACHWTDLWEDNFVHVPYYDCGSEACIQEMIDILAKFGYWTDFIWWKTPEWVRDEDRIPKAIEAMADDDDVVVGEELEMLESKAPCE
jgi:hypothetical protein